MTFGFLSSLTRRKKKLGWAFHRIVELELSPGGEIIARKEELFGSAEEMAGNQKS